MACLAGATIASIALGQDANWDLQNYHYYNPWAWWHGRIFGPDIAAAQLQTFHNVLFDLPFFAMVSADWPPPLIAAVLALPAGIAAYILGKLLLLMFSDLAPWPRRIAIGSSFAIGVTSAMGAGVLGTTMNEWPLVALVMASLWLVIRAIARSDARQLPLPVLAFAGAILGVASGGKLTAATFAVGLCVALLLRMPDVPRPWRTALVEAFLFGVGVLAGLMLAYGPWAWTLWTHFESPVFPYGNEWIRSPWWGEYPVLVRRYGPHNLGEWLSFPFQLLGPGPFFVSEVPYRDVRWPMLWAMTLVAAAAWISNRIARTAVPRQAPAVAAAWRVVTVFVVTSFILWTAQHSVYRYIVTLDMLSGALIVTLLVRLLRSSYAPGVVVLVAIAVIASTRHADWWHVDFGPKWFDVKVPAIEENALVLITTEAPVAYVLPFLPGDARHLGVANSVNDPTRTTKLAEAVGDVIRDHRGPFYQLTFPAGKGADVLQAYALQRIQSTCSEIRSGMITSPIELCRLERTPDTTAGQRTLPAAK